MPRTRALIGNSIPSGQAIPKDKFGDKKGYYPEPSQSQGRSQAINLTSQCLRHGKQGMSSVNWEAFGAKGNKGRKVRDKRPMRLQNSPVPHNGEIKGRFDQRSGKFTRKIEQPVKIEAKGYRELIEQVKRSGKPVNPYKQKPHGF